MLEKPALTIRSVSAEWRIYEPDTGHLLGLARRCRTPGPFGIGWLGKSTLNVFEAEDEPLILIVRRTWAISPKWEICDADEHRIALVRRGSISDPSGDDWASIDSIGHEILIQSSGRELARVRKAADNVCLAFSPEIQSNPLTKMSVLGAVLVIIDW